MMNGNVRQENGLAGHGSYGRARLETSRMRENYRLDILNRATP
jgi:hypothetical protein